MRDWGGHCPGFDRLPPGPKLSPIPGPSCLQEVVVSPWYNLSAQEIQPLFTEHRGPGGGPRTHCCLRDAWEGGSSLLVAGAIPPDAEHVAVR